VFHYISRYAWHFGRVECKHILVLSQEFNNSIPYCGVEVLANLNCTLSACGVKVLANVEVESTTIASVADFLPILGGRDASPERGSYFLPTDFKLT